MKVLIVDDSEIIRQRLKKLFHFHDNLECVGEAANGLEAIHLVGTLRPDVVILDIYMPEKDGLFVLEWTKRNCPEIQVMMFTNYADDQMRKKCEEAGADFFFDKSTEFEKVFDVLNAEKGRTGNAARNNV